MHSGSLVSHPCHPSSHPPHLCLMCSAHSYFIQSPRLATIVPILPSTSLVFNTFEVPGCPPSLPILPSTFPMFNVFEVPCPPWLSPTITHSYLTSAQFLQTCKLTS